jgi:hypothetical protein
LLAKRLHISVGDDLPIPLGAGARRRHVSVHGETEITDLGSERQRSRRARVRDARQAPQPGHQARIEIDNLRRVLVSGGRQRNPHRQHAGRIQSEIELLQRPQGSQHQAGTDEQHHGERHFDDDECVAEAAAAAARRRVRAAFLHRIGDAGPEQANRWCQAERDSRGNRDQRGKNQNAGVHRRRGDARNARRVPRRQRPHTERGQQQAGNGADAGKHEAFGHQLTDDSSCPGAERTAHGHLALTRLGTREQQIGDVRARDQQQKADGAEKQPDRPADGADDFLTQRQHHGVELHLARVQSAVRPRLRERVEIIPRLIDRYAGLEPRRRIVAVVAMIGARLVPSSGSPQRARRGILEVGRQDELGRHDADDLVRHAVDLNRPPDHPRVAGVPPLPEAVPENHEVRAVRHVLFGREQPSTDRRHTEHRKQVRGHRRRGEALRLSVSGEIDLTLAPGSDIAQRPRLPPVTIHFAVGHPRLIEGRPAAPDHHGAVGVAPRQRPEQHGVHHAENGGIGADAERQRQHRNAGKTGVAAEGARAEAQVLQKGFHRVVRRGGTRQGL